MNLLIIFSKLCQVIKYSILIFILTKFCTYKICMKVKLEPLTIL